MLTNRRANIERVVSVDQTRTLIIDDAVSGVFYLELTRPSSTPTGDGDPRDYPTFTLRWNGGLLAPPVALAHAGSRVEVLEAVYELLSAPRELTAGTRVVAFEVEAQRVDVLYPYVGQLVEQKGDVVLDAIRWTLWSPTERHEGTGDYEDFSAAAPADLRDEIHRNRRIKMGGDTYHILTASVALDEARVVFNVRRAGG